MSTNHLLKVTIAHPSKILFDGEVFSMTIPTTEGEITVLANHEPIIIGLKKGIIVLQTKMGSEKERYEIDGGVLELSINKATVLL